MWKVIALMGLAAAAAGVTFGVVRGKQAEELARLPEREMPGRLLVGFQDEPTLRWGTDRMAMLDRARAAGAAVVRTTVSWAQAAPARPRAPASPFDPAYRLDDVDELARNAQARGMELLITIWGTPGWANGGGKPNVPPDDAADLSSFAEALADRYSGRHPGYPAVRLFSAWNEPNLELFLAPQFDAQGRPAAPAAYARLARAVVEGVGRGNPDALVAIGETSARGRDFPAPGPAQESHSPAQFARLVALADPDLPFDAWSQHPYPTRPGNPPSEPVRWPGVGLTSLERFGRELERWFGRDRVPLWITEYGHETRPAEPLGVSPAAQARFAREAMSIAAGNPRVRMLVWFVLRDSAGNPWQSGLLDGSGRVKPAWYAFSGAARAVDGQDPMVEGDADTALVPALELAYHNAAGTSIAVEAGGRTDARTLRQDGWLEVLVPSGQDEIAVTATDDAGRSVARVVRRQP
ncbi:MAG TPA: cellulase family glycosylhydrolase [Gaiellaceae bacterium]|nr:cellulase family glycosylhydrolase [Gaiellaceae bacterium]